MLMRLGGDTGKLEIFEDCVGVWGCDNIRFALRGRLPMQRLNQTKKLIAQDFVGLSS